MIKIVLLFILFFAIFYVISVLFLDSALSTNGKDRMPAAVEIEKIVLNLNQWLNGIEVEYLKFRK